MIEDLEIVNFYNDVKDSAWPDICSYADYQRLPVDIKIECESKHDFLSRKKQIMDIDYWTNSSNYACVYKNLAFVPVAKCGYVFHTTLFHDLGWQKIRFDQLDLNNINFFGVIKHPLQRRLKGITEWLIRSYDKNDQIHNKHNPWLLEPGNTDWDRLISDLDSVYMQKLLRTVEVGDGHSASYHTLFGTMLDKINWIPMDYYSDSEVQNSMVKFCDLHGVRLELPNNVQRLHVSNEKKLQIFEFVKELFFQSNEPIYQFYKTYNKDINFFYNLIDNFSLDWQHLK